MEGTLSQYMWLWDSTGVDLPIDPDEHYVVAVEANGNLIPVGEGRGRAIHREVESPMSLDDYRYLWDGSQLGWALLASGDSYLPFNQKTRGVLIIEDDHDLDEVIEKLMGLGVPVIQPQSLI